MTKLTDKKTIGRVALLFAVLYKLIQSFLVYLLLRLPLHFDLLRGLFLLRRGTGLLYDDDPHGG